MTYDNWKATNPEDHWLGGMAEFDTDEPEPNYSGICARALFAAIDGLKEHASILDLDDIERARAELEQLSMVIRHPVLQR